MPTEYSDLAGTPPASGPLRESHSSLRRTQAPVLAAATSAFWRRWSEGATTCTASGLWPSVEALGAAPGTISAGFTDSGFATEARAWLDATGLWAGTMEGDARLGGLAVVDGCAPPASVVTPARFAPGYAGLGAMGWTWWRLTWVFASPAPSIDRIVLDGRSTRPVVRIHPED